VSVGEAVEAYVAVGSNIDPRQNVLAGLLELDGGLVLPHTRQPVSCLWPGGCVGAGMTVDVELTRQLKELCRK